MMKHTEPRTPTWLKIGVAIVPVALLATACGGDETEPAAGDNGTAAAQDETAGDDTGGDGMPVDLSGVSIIASSSQPGALLLPQFYALDLLGQWGADLETVTLTNVTGIQAMAAGRTNLGTHGADELILGAAEGSSPTAVGALIAKQEYVLVGAGDVTSVEAMEGATIGISGPAGFDALLTRFVLEDAGLDPESDVNFVQIGGSPDRAAALLSGNIDAATIGVDNWFELEAEDVDAQIVVRMAEFVPDYPSSMYFGLASFWEENPKAALGVACANLEANKWAQENKQAFIDRGTESIEGADPAAVEQLYDYAIEVGMYPTDPAEVLSTRGMEGLMEAMLEHGDISQPVDIDALIDTSHLEEAASLGCGQ